MITIEVIIQLVKYFAVGVVTTIIGVIFIVTFLFVVAFVVNVCDRRYKKYIELQIHIIKLIGACSLLIIVLTILGWQIVSDMGW